MGKIMDSRCGMIVSCHILMSQGWMEIEVLEKAKSSLIIQWGVMSCNSDVHMFEKN